jgi:hypothetical protein
MSRPHINRNAALKQEVEENFDSTFHSKKLHLVPTTTISNISEDQRVQALREQVKLSQKDQLLQNFRIREQELKASFFHPKAETEYNSLRA